RKAVRLSEAFEHLHIIRGGRVRFRPRHHRALLEAQRMVWDDKLGVEFEPLAKAVARGAGALRRVEAEQARLDFRDGEARDRAGKFLAENQAIVGYASALHRPAN